MLVRSLGLVEDSSALTFRDVEPGSWYGGAVGAAQKAGLAAGQEDGAFDPNALITRGQMAALIMRAMQAADGEAKADPQALERFRDRDAVSDWAKEAIAQAMSAGVMQGMADGTFAPRAQATRAQATVMLKNMLQALHFIN